MYIHKIHTFYDTFFQQMWTLSKHLCHVLVVNVSREVAGREHRKRVVFPCFPMAPGAELLQEAINVHALRLPCRMI